MLAQLAWTLRQEPVIRAAAGHDRRPAGPAARRGQRGQRGPRRGTTRRRPGRARCSTACGTACWSPAPADPSSRSTGRSGSRRYGARSSAVNLDADPGRRRVSDDGTSVLLGPRSADRRRGAPGRQRRHRPAPPGLGLRRPAVAGRPAPAGAPGSPTSSGDQHTPLRRPRHQRAGRQGLPGLARRLPARGRGPPAPTATRSWSAGSSRRPGPGAGRAAGRAPIAREDAAGADPRHRAGAPRPASRCCTADRRALPGRAPSRSTGRPRAPTPLHQLRGRGAGAGRLAGRRREPLRRRPAASLDRPLRRRARQRQRSTRASTIARLRRLSRPSTGPPRPVVRLEGASRLCDGTCGRARRPARRGRSTCCSAAAASAAPGPVGCCAGLRGRSCPPRPRPAWPTRRPPGLVDALGGRGLRRRGPGDGARPQGAPAARPGAARWRGCWPAPCGGAAARPASPVVLVPVPSRPASVRARGHDPTCTHHRARGAPPAPGGHDVARRAAAAPRAAASSTRPGSTRRRGPPTWPGSMRCPARRPAPAGRGAGRGPAWWSATTCSPPARRRARRSGRSRRSG